MHNYARPSLLCAHHRKTNETLRSPKSLVQALTHYIVFRPISLPIRKKDLVIDECILTLRTFIREAMKINNCLGHGSVVIQLSTQAKIF